MTPTQQDYQAQRIEAGSDAMNRMGLYTPEWRQKLSTAIIAAADSVQCAKGCGDDDKSPQCPPGAAEMCGRGLGCQCADYKPYRTQRGETK